LPHWGKAAGVAVPIGLRSPEVEARYINQPFSGRLILKSDRMFCDMAEAWASIWFLARPAASVAKSVSWMLEREASIF